ncbi:putative metal-binding motif-containing protein [Flagellimonas myxillae]|uniref:putative metal-binding motif-containing protein n=1 Tax=Flagellimonas myxillae TaxID=2942214 RepID=UPI00201F9EF0|nr:putative metal-binding motif-containing protein [Muricauda myxillae]MCL6266268.1 putative metal-binding motif-containing protein [Muricauda myxillae]
MRKSKKIKQISSFLALAILTLLLFTYSSCGKDDDKVDDEPTEQCTEADKITYYADEDGDDYGDPNNTIKQCPNVAIPDGYVADNTDCDDSDANKNQDETTAYQDLDGDGYGSLEVSTDATSCDIPKDYVLISGDCNDSDNNIHPGADEDPYDGIDSDCDGTEETPPTIWDGPDFDFEKEANADWTDPDNQDILTENVAITRQNDGPIYNYQWWQETFGEDAVHVESLESSDIDAIFWGDLDYAINQDLTEGHLQGGTQRVRWAILDPGEGNYDNTAWENFKFYGIPGIKSNFYSFNNIFSMINLLEYDKDIITGVIDDFTLEKSLNIAVAKSFNRLEGKKLALWLVKDNIYLILTFNSWDTGFEMPGGAFSYTRSTPNNNN